LKLVSPALLRRALMANAGRFLVLKATYDLFDGQPGMSARIVVKGWQSMAAGALGVALPLALWATPGQTWFSLHLFFSLFFLACIALRWGALAVAAPPRRRAAVQGPAGDMPVYSLLVALYREASVVPELVASLERMEWPRNRLEIKLVCEADDRETLHALRRIALPPYMEVVEVPAFGPRTKPKALDFALPLARGELVALYDAEDHPHPRQLLEAWHKFRESPPEVACVQAPLEIVNRSDSLIARMFAFEYASLFRGLLPFLAGRRLLVPLGGTSNHFRRSALEEVGVWDPFNVTEDADLGVRLARFGYRTETIACPTWEAGPAAFATWLPQRTRWLKGWMQTWLVHMRQPARLLRDLGPGSFVICQILFAGMVLSALAHPLFLATGLVLAVDLLLDRPANSWKSALLAIDIVNVGCGYLSFLLLGWRVCTPRERLGFWKVVLFTPLYWMMMSLAAWRALLQLCRKPHLWEKTPHQPLKGAARERGPHRAATLTTAVSVQAR
jgi:cellulose synthase/poly-beta-1,6-N-acetylglucosamine synthase-like glycosyltransferase